MWIRRSRERQRVKLRSIRLDIRQNKVEKLILRGLLAADDGDNADAIADALGKLLDRVLI